MENANYLLALTARLGTLLARWPEADRARHVAYLQAAQGADGGFSGRQGGSDLYYTAFGLRSLAVLDALTADVRERAASYLNRSLKQEASVVDFFSLLSACVLIQNGGGPDVLAGSVADWPERVSAALETFRTADGGYARSAGAASGSTYHTFLVGLCYQMLGRALPHPDQVLVFLRSRRRDDGGYVEIAPMRRSGTNPTAAAAGLLQLLDRLTPEVAEEVAAFLSAMQDGGFRANGRAPLADLLSTFTSMWTLDQLGKLDRMDRQALDEYVRLVDRPSGGFQGGLWDTATDVEYTFYGLGARALLAAEDR